MNLRENLTQYLDQNWRLNNLYHIISKDGRDINFSLNYVQSQVLQNLRKRNLILKARQLGMSTFAVLYLLDNCLWNANTAGGIVSYSLEHAQHIFKRIIGHALDSLPKWLNPGIVNRSAREITFSNGSFLRVDTTLRGGAYQKVLVSEFGKTCARSPQKAEEVITGTLQAIDKNATVIIESTGEGNDGYFADMVTQADLRGNENLTDLDYYLFFFPWFQEPTYSIDQPITYGVELTDYFNKLEIECKTIIDKQQRFWYVQQKSLLGDKIKQEFPSTISEAFLSSSDAYYFALCIADAYNSNRCLYTSLYDALNPVYVAMDIGVNDLTVIVFFHVIHSEIRIIDYYEDKNKGVDFYAKHLLQDKNYIYHTIFLPHDSAKRDGIVVENSYEREFKRLFSHTQTKFVVLKKTDKGIQISNAKQKLSRCVFNLSRVKPLLDMMGKYRKKWSEQYGKYLDDPYHGIESNYADAFIYAMQAVSQVEVLGSQNIALQRHKLAVENRRKMI